MLKTFLSWTKMQNIKIAIITSRFNEEITQKLYDGTLARLKELHIPENQITSIWVPGAIEIPITAQRLALTQNYAAIICLGAVIMGETKHFDYVCQQVSFGCQQVALTHNIPVIFGVLTTETEEQAFDRVGGNHGHMGYYAAETAIELINTFSSIS